MKKLMKTVVASAVALVASGAFADLPSPANPMGFEDLTASNKYTVADFVSLSDIGTTEGNRYWFAITNNNQEASAELATIANDNDAHGNYLSIEAGAPLYRTINAVSDGYGASFGVSGAAAETIGSDGVYLDTMVKFTVSSEDTFSDLDSVNDKLAITCYSAEDSNVTNILVRAGYVDSEGVTPTNYVLNLPEGFNVDAWHRLTVRAINVGCDAAPVGFVIYLDGSENNSEPLTYANNVAAGDEDYVESLNGIVKTYIYTDSKHALLPSLIPFGGNNYAALSAVGFKGTGSLDDIQFTTDPGFIDEGETVTIAWDSGVATYTVVDSNNKTLVDGEATSGVGSTNLTLDAGVTYLTVTATYATNYTNGTWTVEGAGAAIAGSTFTVANGATLNIVSMLPKFEVNGVLYGSFEDALDNATGTQGSPATIRMLADYTGDIAFDPNVVNYIVLDLAGQTLTGDADAAIHTGCANLTITNSTETIGHVVAPEAGLAVVLEADAVLAVYAGIFDGEIADDSGDTAVLTIYGGSFYDAYYVDDPTGDFYLKNFVAEGLTISDPVEGYFTVSESVEPPAPTTYALTLPTGVNATATVTAGGVEVADITAIEADTEVVVTWTANAGYKITAGATENITMSENMTAATPTVAAITYATLTINTVANCSIVVSNATEEVASGTTFDVDDNVSLTVYRTPAEGYELDGCAATENITMDQDRTVTAAVKQSGGSYPSYIPDDPAVKAKYDAWATKYGADTGSVNEDAFLLNCAPADVETEKAAFKLNITIDGSTVTVTGPDGKDYNAAIQLQGSNDLSTWTDVGAASTTYKFYKAVLSL